MYELVLDTIAYAVRYGVSWVTLLLVLVALFKNRKLRKKFNHYLPPLLRDEQDSEVGKYIQNQKRIEQKVDLLLQERGIPWNANSLEATGNHSAMLKETWSISRWVGSITAPIARSNTHSIIRRKKIMQKLKSRKLWMAVVSGILVVLNEGLGLGVNTETVIAFTGIVMSYIIGQSHVDGKKNDMGDSGPAV
jgi:hypothetical protein